MHKWMAGLVLGTWALAACAPVAPTRPDPKASRAPATAPGGAKATAQPPGATPAAAGPVQKLAPPPAGATVLKGQLQLDRSYLLGAGGGKAVKLGALDVITADGGALIGNDGSTLIGNDGSTMVAAGGGNVIAPAGARLIGNDGSTLIGNDGSTLIGNDGSTMVAAGGGNYRLAQAAGVTRAPVAGALVGAIDLRTGQAAPIGKDPGGKDVFLAYTDAEGRFALFLPPDQAENVLIVSSAAAAGKPDPRLALSVIATADRRDDVKLDEVESVVTGYLRTCLVTRLESALAFMDAERRFGLLAARPYEFPLEALAPSMLRLKGAADEESYQVLGAQARTRAIQAAVDAFLARISIRDAKVLADVGGPQATGTATVPIFLANLAKLEAAAAARLASDPTFFTRSAVVRYADLERPADRAYRILKPSDYAGMVVSSFMARPGEQYFDLVGIGLIEIGLPTAIETEMAQAGVSLFYWLTEQLRQEANLAATEAALRAQLKAEIAAKRPEAPVAAWPAAPAVPAAEATLLASLPARSGPVPAEPAGMPILPIAEGLLVGDGEAGTIHLVTPDGKTRTLGSGGQPLKLGEPAGLALGPDGALYVADPAQHLVWRVATPLGNATAAPFAGAPNVSGPPGAADQAALDARFLSPRALAFGPDGDLYVGQAGYVRRIGMAAAAHPVRTYVGGAPADGELPYFDADDGPSARVGFPRGLAFGPRGLLIGDGLDGRLRLALPGAGRADGASGPVTSLGGSSDRIAWQDADRPAYSTRVEGLGGIAATADGRVFIAEAAHGRVLAWRPDGWTTAVRFGAGGPAFKAPLGLAVAPEAGADGPTLYVADAAERKVWRVKPGRY